MFKNWLDWAPPVVSGNFLIENVLAGYIAQKLLPLEKIKVKELGKSVQPYFHLADFFVFLPQLEELYQKHQKQIVRLAPTAEVALALTDLEKAWIHRLRSRLMNIYLEQLLEWINQNEHIEEQKLIQALFLLRAHYSLAGIVIICQRIFTLIGDNELPEIS